MDSNFLIISDLHLGYRAKDLSFNEYKAEVSEMDDHFNKLIKYYTDLYNDKKWELIINGDFIDFIQINYRIEVEVSNDYKLSLDDIRYGMNNKESHIVWKLNKIAKIHNRIFRDIAEFINAGNSFVLLKGNHDVEFFWPKVKIELKNILASFIEFNSEEDREAFIKRIKVKDWIYHKKDLFYIEHGNQYDDYTSFNHFITPIDPINYKKIEMPYSHVSMRYWINLTKDFETHNLANWGIKDFLAWLKREGLLGMIMHVFYYFRALFMMLNNIKFVNKFDLYLYLKERYYIKKISEIYNLEPKLLFKINNLKRAPVGNTVYGVLSSFYIEGFLILLSFIIFLIYSIWIASFLKIFFAFFLFISFSIMFFIIFSYDREIEPENKIIEASSDISKLIEVKFYIFGHTHHPQFEKIGKDKYYINSGSWILRSPKNVPGEFNHNLSHITIIDDKAVLRLWKSKYDKPIDFEDFIKEGGKL